jgi:hypothetical protein
MPVTPQPDGKAFHMTHPTERVGPFGLVVHAIIMVEFAAVILVEDSRVVECFLAKLAQPVFVDFDIGDELSITVVDFFGFVAVAALLHALHRILFNRET